MLLAHRNSHKLSRRIQNLRRLLPNVILFLLRKNIALAAQLPLRPEEVYPREMSHLLHALELTSLALFL